MTIDLSKIQPGDELTVRVKVARLHLHRQCGPGPGVEVEVSLPDRSYVNTDTVEIRLDDIVSHTPAPKKLAVGDRVRNARCKNFPPGYQGGEIMAIVDGWAMVRFDRTPGVVELSTLERVP